MSQVRVPADSGYVENALFTASRVMIGIFAFAFAALAFAYFYLRSTNSAGLWRPHDVTAPVATGTAIMALVLASTGLLAFGLRQFRRSDTLDWDVAGWTAVASGLLALGLQCWELTDLPFSPSTGGYTSVFLGWAVMDIILLVSGVYWAETLLARHARVRKAATEDSRSAGFASAHFRVNVESCTYFWGFIAFVSVFFWVFFYIAG
jgi:heme/copper-type cytochrome/quinol oxidase subunit 3